MLTNPALCFLDRIVVVLKGSLLLLQRFQVGLPGTAHSGFRGAIGVGRCGIFVQRTCQCAHPLDNRRQHVVSLADRARLP